jgi:Rod binding domain-containing protein
MKIDESRLTMRPGSKGRGEKPRSMEKAAEEFEAYFIGNLLKELQKTTQLTEKSYAEEMQMSIFYEKVAECMAKKGIGIKGAILKYLREER